MFTDDELKTIDFLTSNTEHLYEEILNQVRDVPLIDLPIEYLDPEKKKSKKEKCIQLMTALLSPHRETLHAIICIQFNYCENKNKYRKPSDLAKAIGELISSIVLELPIAAFISTAYILENYFLDELCKCGIVPQMEST